MCAEFCYSVIDRADAVETKYLKSKMQFCTKHELNVNLILDWVCCLNHLLIDFNDTVMPLKEVNYHSGDLKLIKKFLQTYRLLDCFKMCHLKKLENIAIEHSSPSNRKLYLIYVCQQHQK